jgi:hypothetical protein
VSRRTIATLFILAMLSKGVTAQIGHDRRDCCRIWGDPISDQIETNGVASLVFQSNGISAEIGFLDGNAQRAVYRLGSIDESGLNHILKLNGENLQWQVWALPSPTPQTTNDRQWMRSDEMAMAQLTSNVLTVLGPQWAQYLEASKPQVSMDLTNCNTAPTPVRTPSLPSPRVDIVGFWRNAQTEQSPIILQIEDSGDLTWIVFGSTERRERKTRWCRAPDDEPSTYTIKEVLPQSSASPRIIGKVWCESPTNLRFRSEKTNSVSLRLSIAPELVFERVAVMPRWKPTPPGRLPAKGTTREQTLRLLGNPEGMMHSGEKEVLVYPWGNIWIGNGIVTAVE